MLSSLRGLLRRLRAALPKKDQSPDFDIPWREKVVLAFEMARGPRHERAIRVLNILAQEAPTILEKFEVYMGLARLCRERQTFDRGVAASQAAVNYAAKIDDDLRHLKVSEALDLKASILESLGRMAEASDARTASHQARDLPAAREKLRPGPEWNASDTATAVHTLTNLHCPVHLEGMTRIRLMSYTPTGDDVGANYWLHDYPGSIATFYFTHRASTTSAFDHFKESKWGIEERMKTAKLRSEGKFDVGPLPVFEAVYSTTSWFGEKEVSGVWVTDLKGWTLKARVSGRSSITIEAIRTAVRTFFSRALADVDLPDAK